MKNSKQWQIRLSTRSGTHSDVRDRVRVWMMPGTEDRSCGSGGSKGREREREEADVSRWDHCLFPVRLEVRTPGRGTSKAVRTAKTDRGYWCGPQLGRFWSTARGTCCFGPEVRQRGTMGACARKARHRRKRKKLETHNPPEWHLPPDTPPPPFKQDLTTYPRLPRSHNPPSSAPAPPHYWDSRHTLPCWGTRDGEALLNVLSTSHTHHTRDWAFNS